MTKTEIRYLNQMQREIFGICDEDIQKEAKRIKKSRKSVLSKAIVFLTK